MKKKLTIIFTVLSLLLILDSMNVMHAIAIFMLAGIIPGTNIVLNADRMLEGFTLLLGFVLARISSYAGRVIANSFAAQPTKVKSSRAQA